MIAQVEPHESEADRRHKVNEIIQLLLKMGIAVPAGWNPDAKGSADVLLAAAKTATLTKRLRAEAEEKRQENIGITCDSQFSESRRRRGSVTKMSAAEARRFSDLTQRPRWEYRR